MTNTSPDHLVIDRGKNETATACVDVLIAARDRADTIERAVLSALAQAEVRTVIVVDDGSTDDTAARARRCDPGGKRVIVERLRSSVGPSAARNVAIEISQAPWLAILDGDDFFLPGRIGALLAVSDDWDFVADDLLQVPEARIGDFQSAPTLSGASFKSQHLTLEEFVLGNVTRRGALRKELGFLKPLIRRSFLDRHGLRYDEALRLGEDYALYARALAVGARFFLISAAGYVSVVRADSLSARHSGQDLERLRDSDRNLMAATTLTPGERQALATHYSSIDCRVQWLAVIEGYKARSVTDFLAPFCQSPRISAYLLERLVSELAERPKRVCRRRASKRAKSGAGRR
jgi:succinoglycan biosynthesis protein ExoU